MISYRHTSGTFPTGSVSMASWLFWSWVKSSVVLSQYSLFSARQYL